MRRLLAQLAAGLVVMLGGAWLVGLWMVGLILILAGAGIGADALLRDPGKDVAREVAGTHEAVLERWRHSR